MSENINWRKLAEENGIDCTLRRVEIECVLEHAAVPGDDFMPYGWCGACETCAAMVPLPVCEACSYTSRYDLKQPVYWPCTHELNRRNAEARKAQRLLIKEIKQRRAGSYGG